MPKSVSKESNEISRLFGRARFAVCFELSGLSRLVAALGMSLCLGGSAHGAPGGALMGWGTSVWNPPPRFGSLTNVVHASGGFRYQVALAGDGTVHVDGTSMAPELLTGARAVAGGPNWLLTLSQSGQVNGYGFASVPSGLSNVIAVVTGPGHSLALKADGTVVGWLSGGGGGAPSFSEENVPAGLDNVIAIAAGMHHSLALKSDGTVAGWGSDIGQNNIFIGAKTPPADLQQVVAIAAGYLHSVALKADGSVVAWGDKYYATPPVSLGGSVKAIAAAGFQTVALKSDGTVVSWGLTSLKAPPELTGVTSIAATPDFCYAITQGPTIFRQPADITVHAGQTASFNVQAAGHGSLAYQWFFNGELLEGAAGPELLFTNAQSSKAGRYSVRVRNASGSIMSFEAALNVNPKPATITVEPVSQGAAIGSSVALSGGGAGSEPLGFQWYHDGKAMAGATSNILQISSISRADEGRYHFVVSNDFGRAESRPAFVAVTKPIIVRGPEFQVVRRGTRAVFDVEAVSPTAARYQWQRNGQDLRGATNSILEITNATAEEEGDYRVVVSNDIGLETSVAAKLRTFQSPERPGTLVMWGDPLEIPPDLFQSLTNIIVADGGNRHGIGLRADGRVVAWGSQVLNNGELNIPAGLSNVIDVAAGAYHNIALARDGTIAVWGALESGQMAAAAGFTNVVAVSAGDEHILALMNNGRVARLGATTGAQSPPPDLSEVISIAAGGRHNVALRADGTVVAWRDVSHAFTQGAEVPHGLTNVVAIAAGWGHSLALRSDGRVVAWGDSQFGQAAPPPGLSNVVAIAAGLFHSVAVESDGRATVWGHDAMEVTAVPEGLIQISRLESGGWRNFAVTPAPFIDVHPVSGTVNAGSDVTFTVAVRSSTPATFQWLANGSEIPGATSSQLILSQVDSAHSGRYAVRVGNAVAVVTSKAAELIVNGPPVVTGPLSQTLSAGQDAQFRVVVAGIGPLTYQWFFNRSAILGATNGLLALTNIQAAAAGVYSAVVENSFGRVNSASAALTVRPSVPVIVEHPESQSVSDGSTATLQAAAMGTEPIAFRWEFNGRELPGETNSMLILNRVSAVHSGSYRAVVMNSAGVTTTAMAELNVRRAAPEVRVAKPFVLGLERSAVTLAPEIIGSEPLAIQWYFNEASLPGETNLVLRISAAELTHSGRYSVIASNALGRVRSENVDLVVLRAPEPHHLIVWGNLMGPRPMSNVVAMAAGDAHVVALFSNGTVAAWGDNSRGQTDVPIGLTNIVRLASGAFHNLAVRNDGSVIAWGDNSSRQVEVPATLGRVIEVSAGVNHSVALTRTGSVVAWGANEYQQLSIPPALSGVREIAAGAFHTLALKQDGRVVAWGDNSAAQSIPPTDLTNAVAIAAGQLHSVALRSSGIVTAWGSNLAGQRQVPPGATNVIAVAARAYHNLALRSDGAVIPWGIHATGQLRIPAGLSGAAAVATGGTYQAPIGLALARSATLLAQPRHQSALIGTEATFQVSADGQDPLAYQWFFNGSAITGATAPMLVISNVTAAHGGNYSVVVSNSVNRVESMAARLTVLYPPKIMSQFSDQTVLAGTNVTWTVTAEGTEPLRYVWRFNGEPLPGESRAVLALSNVQLEKQGFYSVEIANAYGQTESAAARLTVLASPPFFTLHPEKQTARAGQDVTLRATAIGSDPLRYQWLFNGTAVADQTNAALTLRDVRGGHAGSYSVVTTNQRGNATSQAALLTVITPAPKAGSVAIDFYPRIPEVLSIRALLAAPNGNVLASGFVSRFEELGLPALLRLDASGNLNPLPEFLGVEGPLWETISDMAFQPDGKLLIAGEFQSVNGTARNGVARLNVDGSLDVTFNSGAGPDRGLSVLAVQPNGRILMGGEFTAFNGQPRPGLVRLLTDGSVDASFHPDPAGKLDAIQEILLQPDGKTLVAGRSGILRLNPDGGLDTGFLNLAPIEHPVYSPSILSMALLPDGKILISGYFTSYNRTLRNRLARLHPDGRLDLTFDTGSGIVGEIEALAIQEDGKILVAGNISEFNNTPQNHILRLNANGTLDSTFTIGTGPNNLVTKIVIASGGDIVLAGAFTEFNGMRRLGLVRLIGQPPPSKPAIETQPGSYTGLEGRPVRLFVSAHAFPPPTYQWFWNGVSLPGQTNALLEIPNPGLFDSGTYQVTVRNELGTESSLPCVVTVLPAPKNPGSPDISFFSGSGPNSGIGSIAVQKNGKVVVGGFFTQVNGMTRNRLARLNTDGGVDSAFALGIGMNGGVNAVAMDADDHILAAGDFTEVNGVSRTRLARFTPDGVLDGVFGAGMGPDSTVRRLAVQSDGRILIVGAFTSVGGMPRRGIARLNRDGSVDQAFNPGAGADAEVLAVAVQRDGRIVITGKFSTVDGLTRNRIARLNGDGTVDSSFRDTPVFLGPIEAVALQSYGQIIVVGQISATAASPAIGGGTIRTWGIARFNSDGTLDTSFTAGTGFSSRGSPTSVRLNSVVVQPDDRILVGGDFDQFNGQARSSLVRLGINGTLDSDFHPRILSAKSGGFQSVHSIALQNNGAIVIGGWFWTIDGAVRPNLARLHGIDQRLHPTLSISRVNSGLRLTLFPAVAGLRYIVESTGDIAASAWTLVTTLSADSDLLEIVIPAPAASSFFRIRPTN